MNPAQTLDINQCVKAVHYWLSTDFVNICTGAVTNVALGPVDVFVPAAFVVLIVGVGIASYLYLSGWPHR